MTKYTSLFLGLLIVVGGAQRLQAQKAPGVDEPMKWGTIPDEHVRMDRYAADTNATAVILADFGHAYFFDDGTLIVERHRRIKILSEAGYDWGTVSIPYYAEGRTQRVRNIKGMTYTVGPNGKLKKHTLSKKSIYTEDIDGTWEQVHFTLPALAPGAVIEYKYTLQADSPLFLEGWQFQHSEPTLWSEYVVEVPAEYQYVTATVGARHFAVNESEEVWVGRHKGMRHRWVMQDVPALREEPFMTTPEDYRAGIEFQLKAVAHPMHGYIEFMTTWEQVAKELMDMSSFGKQLKPSRRVRRQVDELTAGMTDPVEKMQALYDYVRGTITWDGRIHLIVDQDGNDVLQSKSATSAEMTFLLLAMLRAADLEAHPVLISTRSHGAVLTIYPLLSQFNDVLAHVSIDGTSYLLDPTDPLRPYDLLPTEALNGQGWLVRDKDPAWIPIEAKGTYLRQDDLQAELAPSGLLTATLKATDAGYSALFKRHLLKAADAEDDFVREVVLENLDEVVVESIAVTNAEVITEPFEAEIAFSLPGYAQVAGDYMYVNPVLINRLGENPLRLPERTFPVDMTYPRNVIYTLRLKLPDGYTVHEAPADLQVRLPANSGHFGRSISVIDGMIIMQCQLRIKRTIFEPEYYPTLRAFYDRIVAAEAEPLVLKRATEAEVGSSN